MNDSISNGSQIIAVKVRKRKLNGIIVIKNKGLGKQAWKLLL